MLIYIIKFSACLAIFMVFYKLVLEKTSMHSFKRFYLLGALMLALYIPSVTLVEYIEPVLTDIDFIPPTASFESVESIPQQTSTSYTPTILWSLYGLGVLVFLLKFCINLQQIIIRIKNNPKYKSERFINVLVSNLMVPHTFFNYIFLNQFKYENRLIPEEVLLHEQAHAMQKHSVDVLIIELLQIVFWFNPLIYLLKHDIKLNHEFLADQAVIKNGVRASTYQNIILAFSSKAKDQQLANAINYSSIKKRFTVMKTKTSKPSIWLKSLLILPLLALLLYSFAEHKQVVKENTDSIALQGNASEGVSEALMKEYKDWIKQLNNNASSLFIPVGTFERLVAIYDLMSEEQRNSVGTHPLLQNTTPELYSTKPNIPTTAQYESWKNEKEYAIWLDRKHISNAELNNYKTNDIAHYTSSKVQSNARSQKFPQPFQINIYTKNGFNKFYTETYVSGYKEICNQYSKAIQDYLKGPQIDNSELKLLKAQADKFYNQFTKDDLKNNNNILPAPPVPMKKPKQEGATKEQIAEYNKLAKYCNSQIAKKGVLKMKDVVRLKQLYGFMSDEQRKNAETLPDFTKLPPPPPPPPTHKGEVSERMEKSYNDWVKSLKNSNGTYNNITTDDYTYFISIYNGMTDEQKKNSAGFPPPPPPPTQPKSNHDTNVKTGVIKIKGTPHYFVTIDGDTSYYNKAGYGVSRDGKVITATQVNASDVVPNQYISKIYSNDELIVEFKDNIPHKNGELNIPPPPPPPPISPIDHIVAMAKKEAKFYYDGQDISSDKAIELVKTEKELNIFTKDASSKKPRVYLTKDTKAPTDQKSKELINVNGKTPVNGQLTLSRHELENLELTFEDLKIVSFKFKVPGKPSRSNSGNSLNNHSKALLKSVSSGKAVDFFDIKDSKGVVHPPIKVILEK